MKIITSCLLLLASVSAWAEQATSAIEFTPAETTIYAQPGETLDLKFNLTNAVLLRDFQLVFTFPTGIDPVYNQTAEKYWFDFNNRLSEYYHTAGGYMSNGDFTIIAYNQTLKKLLASGSGLFCNIKIYVNPELPSGVYSILAHDCLFYYTNGSGKLIEICTPAEEIKLIVGDVPSTPLYAAGDFQGWNYDNCVEAAYDETGYTFILNDTRSFRMSTTTGSSLNHENIPARALSSGFKVYFDNSTANWRRPYVHYWGAIESTWPGAPMEYLKEEIWVYEVPAGTTGLVFSNKGKPQTADFVAKENHLYDSLGDKGVFIEDESADPTPKTSFDDGSLGVLEEQLTNPGTYQLIASTVPIILPWRGDWTIKVNPEINLMTISTTTSRPNDQPAIPGDANGDFIVDATDISYIVDFVLGISHDNFLEDNADLNNDGKVNASDISHIIRALLGI